VSVPKYAAKMEKTEKNLGKMKKNWEKQRKNPGKYRQYLAQLSFSFQLSGWSSWLLAGFLSRWPGFDTRLG